jgi:DNA-directed RNA polymerase specialized sigma24 family protein
MTAEPSSPKSPDNAQDALFSQRANSAWGIAFVTTEAVTSATDAVADGFAELFQAVETGNAPTDTHFEALRLTRSAAMRILAAGPGGRHSREPVSILGETKDRQATLALTALIEPSRSALWLVEAEHLTIEQTAAIMEQSVSATEAVLRRARSDFRRYYVDATKRDGLQGGCAPTLDRLSGYSNQTLNAGDRAAVDAHLTICDSCRSVVAKLDDLESRLQAAIPAVPAWTRQYVMDTWEAISTHQNITHLGADKRPRNAVVGRRVGAAVAAAVVVAATVVGLTYPSKEKDDQRETTSSQLAAPTATTTTTEAISAPQNDDEPSVATPVFRAIQPEVSADVVEQTTETVAVADSARSTTKPADQNAGTTAAVSSPSTTAPVKVTTTTPPAEEDDQDVLVDLPSVPASTTTTTARQGSRNN